MTRLRAASPERASVLSPLEARTKLAIQQSQQPWDVERDTSYGGWNIVLKDRTAVGWFAEWVLAQRAHLDHNMWLGTFIGSMQYKKAYTFAMATAIVVMAVCLIVGIRATIKGDAFVSVASGFGLVAGGIGAILALRLFREGE